MIEVYKNERKNPKTYLVADFNYLKMKTRADDDKLEEFITNAMRYFKVSPNRLFMTSVWVLNDEMYLANPHKRGAKQLTAICLINNKIKEYLGI